MTYFEDLHDRLNGRLSRKVANHTYLQYDLTSGWLHVRYHDTNVVRLGPSGQTHLSTGGWLTSTTRARMNAFTPKPVQVFTTKGRWYVTYQTVHKGGLEVPDFAGAVPFKDGVVVMPGAWASNHLTPDEVAAQDRHNRQVDRLIDRWLKDLDSRDRHPQCAMCVRTGVGTLVGDEFGNVTHLVDHLTDKEYPGDLLVVAAESRYGRSVYRDKLLHPVLRTFLRQRLYTGPVAMGHGRRPQFAQSWTLTRRSA